MPESVKPSRTSTALEDSSDLDDWERDALPVAVSVEREMKKED